MTATGQPCSSANSRNAAHASARCADRTDRIGRDERDAVVHAVRDERVAEAEPLLVVAQREVRQRVGAVPLDEEPRPLARQRAERRQRAATTAGRNSNQQHRQRDPDADREQRRRDAAWSMRCGNATDRSPTSRSDDRRRSRGRAGMRGRCSSTPTTPADDRDRDRRRAPPDRRAAPTTGSPGAAKSSRWIDEERRRRAARAIASSMSRPLITWPTTLTSSSA